MIRVGTALIIFVKKHFRLTLEFFFHEIKCDGMISFMEFMLTAIRMNNEVAELVGAEDEDAECWMRMQNAGLMMETHTVFPHLICVPSDS